MTACWTELWSNLTVYTHRCATYQSDDGKWNKFGGRLAWDKSAICNNNPAWGGRGAHKTGDDYPAAPNIDHTQVGCFGWLVSLETICLVPEGTLKKQDQGDEEWF